jgi:NAD(P)-dependent dehydrogenase (short-subunit alcohol dehydrogenase family)
MKEFQGKVAVITGAASGIGRALADACCAEGMKVVLADVERAALARTEEELRARGGAVLAVPTDVSVEAQVQALAREALEAFGAVHLVVNNAGVGTAGLLWEQALTDWQWVVGVNFWGVVHGIRTFVPILLRQGAEGHVVNTASVAGLLAGPGNGIYGATKFAVVALSESLHFELGLVGGHVGVSVLCPGYVRTRILESERNRPAELRGRSPALTPEQKAVAEWVRRQIDSGTPPAEIAAQVLEAVKTRRFFVLPHPEFDPLIERRTRDLLARRNPELPPPPPGLTIDLAGPGPARAAGEPGGPSTGVPDAAARGKSGA